MHKTQQFPVAPLHPYALWWLWVPMLLAIAGVLVAMTMQARPPAPGVWGTIPFVLLVGTGLGWAAQRRRITLDNRELQVAATLYTRKLALEALDLGKARVVSLEEHTDLKPAIKTNGFSLPGLKAGHFRLRNLSKAFCLVTDPTRVLVLPLRNGGLLLLSPERPQDLLLRLRELAAPAPHR
jgi:hypothetical protein